MVCLLEQKCKTKYCLLLIGLDDLKYIHVENEEREEGTG